MTVVGREKMVVFDDMEPERKVTVYEKHAGPSGELYSGDISIPKISTAEPLRLECTYFLELIAGSHDRGKVARDGARVVRALEMLTEPRSMADVHETAIVHPGTVLGEGVRVLEYAVVGKQPSLAPSSTAKRDPLPPTQIGAGTVVSTGAVVFAGTTVGERCIVGDQSCIRERVAARRRLRARPRLVDRERHDGRRGHADPGGRLHHRLLDARGGRVHRSVRRDDERQLHGEDRGAEG